MTFMKDYAYGTENVSWGNHHIVNMAFKAGPDFVSLKLMSPDVTGETVDNYGALLCRPDRSSPTFACSEPKEMHDWTYSLQYDIRERKVTVKIVSDMAWMDGLIIEDQP